MSMAWMRMHGQSWLASSASFMGMWIVMMAAMMLPALVPTLLRYRLSLRGPKTIHQDALTVVAGAGYFFLWALLGAVVYPFGVFVAMVGMSSAELSRLMPIAAGLVLLLAGGLQLTPWKARQLCRCRVVPTLDQSAYSAWRYGIRLGADCVLCCCGLMATLLVAGVMNLGAMALVTIAITAERLFPEPQWAARAAAFVIIATGVFIIGGAMSAHLTLWSLSR
jgi:predicted metal-binding membrane protein